MHTFTATAASSTDYATTVLADAPAGYWRLAEASATTAADRVGTNSGTYFGGPALGQAGALPGDADTAVRLDGTDDTVRVPSGAALSSTSAMALETWVKPTVLPAAGATATIIRKDSQYMLRLNSAGRLIFRLWKGGAVTEVTTPAGTVAAGAWTHVVASFDGATMTVYVNGVSRASGALAAPVDTSASGLFFGSSVNSYDFIAATLDEVAVYTSALSSTRVQAHFTAASVPDTTAPTVTLTQPANGASTGTTPSFAGVAGRAAGDGTSVTVKVYNGVGTAGALVQTQTASVGTGGSYSVTALPSLAPGTYTGQAQQADSAGNVGFSAANTFTTTQVVQDAMLVAAGDIAGCNPGGAETTAALLDGLPEATVATLGDTTYPNGALSEFTSCYEPTWGRAKARTRPSLGNHEYATPSASGYFTYFADVLRPFGPDAADPTKGWYSYDLGEWHVIALNSECSQVGGCGGGSRQEQWLRADLSAHPAQCTLAYWHKPRFSSGAHGSYTGMQPLWQALYDNGADVVLSGHDHLYERFAPQTPTGTRDLARGITQFTVGTGGYYFSAFGTILPNSEARINDAYGILKLTLRSAGYDWQFVPQAGKTSSDSGAASCH